MLVLCFNPHTHEGCDKILISFYLYFLIVFQSTHPRRVWLSKPKWWSSDCKFQSTHPRRVWHGSGRVWGNHSGFNPHTHEGCDFAALVATAQMDDTVSIHTPTKGVTLNFARWYNSTQFQSTHPRRVWHSNCTVCFYQLMFQSTHPRRVWHLPDSCRELFLDGFNPHTHEGCDANS